MTPKISYAITVCTEAQEFRKLLDTLKPFVRPEDEIVVLQDVSKDFRETTRVLEEVRQQITSLTVSEFEGDFAAWKNKLNSYCTGDYIVQLDADEIPSEKFLQYLPEVLEMNEGIDLIYVPRENRVEGLTDEDVKKWHWHVDQQGRVNWPDLQGRIYRNSPELFWEGKVHEKIRAEKGPMVCTCLIDSMCLYHFKSIEKQRSQNDLYTKIQNGK